MQFDRRLARKIDAIFTHCAYDAHSELTWKERFRRMTPDMTAQDMAKLVHLGANFADAGTHQGCILRGKAHMAVFILRGEACPFRTTDEFVAWERQQMATTERLAA